MLYDSGRVMFPEVDASKFEFSVLKYTIVPV